MKISSRRAKQSTPGVGALEISTVYSEQLRFRLPPVGNRCSPKNLPPFFPSSSTSALLFHSSASFPAPTLLLAHKTQIENESAKQIEYPRPAPPPPPRSGGPRPSRHRAPPQQHSRAPPPGSSPRAGSPTIPASPASVTCPQRNITVRGPMPLFNKKPFSLLEPPKDLDPEEKVFQIRFTKEIFLDYQEYVKRLNLYRQRVWTCKVSGKSNLTFEEALVSEHQAMEKAQNLPTELMGHVLRMTQYSTLGLIELVNKIYVSLWEDVFEGIEVHAQKDGSEAPCKILKIVDSGDTKLYEVGWIRQGKSKAVINTSVVKATDLIRRRAPVGRNILKLLIRDSTSHRTPWIIHEHLAKKYGIPMEPPKNIMYGEGLQKKGKKRHDCVTTEDGRKKSKKDEEHACVPIKYPIDDLLVSPAADDPALLKRPPLATDFGIPRNSVGDLLMVWDFCLSFGRVLNLYPFSLADLENAICHKESNVLIMEIHSALFHLLIEDDGDYFTAPQNNKRKTKLSLEKWAEYLSFFLEKTKIEEFSGNTGAVRRGYYGLIDADMKLKILRELVEEAITTDAIREKLSERVEQQQALVATKREIARKEKEEKNKNMKNENNAVVQDGDECVDEQGKGKEERDKRDISASKTEKLHLVRHLETEREKLSIRASPLGKDRHYNRYWFFKREGRLFVESADSKEWGYYSTKEELDVFMGSLNVKGIRERALKLQLDKFYNSISNALEKRLKEITHNTSLEEAVLRRSTRVRAQPRDSPSMAFLKYVNKWNEH